MSIQSLRTMSALLCRLGRAAAIAALPVLIALPAQAQMNHIDVLVTVTQSIVGGSQNFSVTVDQDPIPVTKASTITWRLAPLAGWSITSVAVNNSGSCGTNFPSSGHSTHGSGGGKTHTWTDKFMTSTLSCKYTITVKSGTSTLTFDPTIKNQPSLN